jgi:hypothetical protein
MYPVWAYCRLPFLVGALSWFISIAWAQDRIGWIEFYDAADNLQLLVENHYEPNGACVGRSVYAPDTFFFRTTVFADDSQGRRTREISSNFNSMPAGELTFSYNSGTTSFSVLSEFGESLFQGRYPEIDGQPTYQITDNLGRSVCTLQYEYGAQGVPSRINILGPSGTMMYHVQVSTTASSMRRDFSQLPMSFHAMQRAGKFKVSFVCRESVPVSCCLFDMQGKLLQSLFKGQYRPGVHENTIEFGHGHFSKAGQMAMIRFTAGTYTEVQTVNLVQIK